MRRVKSQERRVESQNQRVALRLNAGSRLSTLDSRLARLRRRAVTLVELLVTLLIITILAGLILGVASVAGETARKAQTRLTIQRLHKLMMEHYDTYKTRRVLLNPALKKEIEDTLTGSKRGDAMAEARLYAAREFMVMEIPDRWSDILLTSVGNTELSPVYFVGRSDLANIYLRRYKSLIAPTHKNTITGNANTTAEIISNQGAECLYMVITFATGDGEARSLFQEDSIGDTDGDGAPEFLDSWGQPIEFLRWAPGFDSQVQLDANQFIDDNDWRLKAAGDHDPFDMFRRDDHAYRLVPLIYSLGGDQSAGLFTEPGYVTWRKTVQTKVNPNKPYLQPKLTPYERGTINVLDDFLGTKVGEGSADNVHNHLLELR